MGKCRKGRSWREEARGSVFIPWWNKGAMALERVMVSTTSMSCTAGKAYDWDLQRRLSEVRHRAISRGWRTPVGPSRSIRVSSREYGEMGGYSCRLPSFWVGRKCSWSREEINFVGMKSTAALAAPAPAGEELAPARQRVDRGCKSLRGACARAREGSTQPSRRLAGRELGTIPLGSDAHRQQGTGSLVNWLSFEA